MASGSGEADKLSIRRHTVYNLAGAVAPMGIALLTVPVYLRLIGEARYGVLAIVWLFIGYFGIFDFGLSRSTAYHLAKLSDAPGDKRSRVFWTALALNTLFGLVGGIILYFAAGFCFLHYFKMPVSIRPEVTASVPWLALAVPVVTVGGVLNGALDSQRRFAYSNSANMLGMILSQLLPIGSAVMFGPELTYTIPAAIAARVLGLVPPFIGAALFVPAGRPRWAEFGIARELFSYAGWVSISNLIIPFLGTLDKLLIGVLLGAVDVTHYTIPDNLTRRTSILPVALVRAMFPVMAAETAQQSQARAKTALDVLGAALTTGVAVTILGMHAFLKLWLGENFSRIATPIGAILALGIFVNGLAYVPCSLLEARGRVNLAAAFHIIEILPHVVFLFLGLRYFGLLGAAWAMLFVNALDAVLLLNAAKLFVWRERRFWYSAAFLVLCVGEVLAMPLDDPTTYLLFLLELSAIVTYFAFSVPELRRQFRCRLMIREGSAAR